MAPNANLPPVIVVKKKAPHHGSHGGAWKVAYADFVTAMMALFIVLWLMNTDQKTKSAIGGYFQDPSGKSTDTGNGDAGNGENLAVTRQDLEKLKQEIEEAFKQRPDFQTALKDKIQMTVTSEGLRIEFLETEAGLFFESGSPVPTRNGTDLLTVLAKQVGVLPSKVLIEGHTDSRPITRQDGYTNWELSSDRANAARRLMQASGVRADQVTQVRGYADQKLRDMAHPDNAVNRRISIVVLNQRV
jgi:chemotaxis protein MotB